MPEVRAHVAGKLAQREERASERNQSFKWIHAAIGRMEKSLMDDVLQNQNPTQTTLGLTYEKCLKKELFRYLAQLGITK